LSVCVGRLPRDPATARPRRRLDLLPVGRPLGCDGPRLAGREAPPQVLYGKTRPEVARKLSAALKALQEGQVLPDERITVEQFLQAWLKTVEPSLRPRTWTRYEQLIRKHATPYVGKLRLTKLDPRHLEELYADRVRSGLSKTTVLQLHRILHHALRDATRWNLVSRNVTELVTPPRKARHDFATLSPEQARRFLDAVKGDRLEALYVLALTTGMRAGELFGLRWADVNLDACALHLVKQLKTSTSRRQVLLVSVAVEALIAHRTRQDEERRQLGAAWDDHDLVFPNTVGRPLHPRNFLRRSFYPLLDRAGCRTSASTTCVTVPRRCCLGSASTRRSSVSCSATARSASHWTYTPTSRLPCSMRPCVPSRAC
jgi:integrase